MEQAEEKPRANRLSWANPGAQFTKYFKKNPLSLSYVVPKFILSLS